MSEHHATVEWSRNEAVFVDSRYHRTHVWRFDGGAVIPASSSPHVVPPPLSDPGQVDPEEAFVAALSSCHMLFFLSIAARKGLTVNSYRDDAFGVLGTDERGRQAITHVVLRPSLALAPAVPAPPEELAALHQEAHARCFLASSVRCEIRIEPR